MAERTEPSANRNGGPPVPVAGSRFAVLGLARSGIAAAKLLLRRGAKVAALDLQPRGRLPPGVAEIEALGGRLVLGPHPVSEFTAADCVVISPGVPDVPVIRAAEDAGVPVVSEVELAAWFLRAPLVAVTGTNGKSTVTTLIGLVLRAMGRPTFYGANLGEPITDAVDGPANSPEGVFVAELSSFQFERTRSLRPAVSLLLNVTDDHLDRHGTFEAYAELKGRVFLGQSPDGFAIVPRGDDVCARQAARGQARVLTFGVGGGDARIEGPDFIWNVPGRDATRVPVASLRIRGLHNLENALAAGLACRCLGAEESHLRGVFETFDGLPHRMKRVGEVGGVVFWNDSKATNVGAAVKAIEGLDRKAVLIAGGRDKLGSYAPMRRAVEAKITRLVLIGEARKAIAAALGDLAPCEESVSMEDAVRAAFRAAKPGEAVLLAPACASYDMFRNYEDRGDQFATAVAALAKEAGV